MGALSSPTSPPITYFDQSSTPDSTNVVIHLNYTPKFGPETRDIRKTIKTKVEWEGLEHVRNVEDAIAIALYNFAYNLEDILKDRAVSIDTTPEFIDLGYGSSRAPTEPFPVYDSAVDSLYDSKLKSTKSKVLKPLNIGDSSHASSSTTNTIADSQVGPLDDEFEEASDWVNVVYYKGSTTHQRGGAGAGKVKEWVKQKCNAMKDSVYNGWYRGSRNLQERKYNKLRRQIENLRLQPSKSVWNKATGIFEPYGGQNGDDKIMEDYDIMNAELVAEQYHVRRPSVARGRRVIGVAEAALAVQKRRVG